MRYGLCWALDCLIIISSTSLSGNLKCYRTSEYFPITKEGLFSVPPNQSRLKTKMVLGDSLHVPTQYHGLCR